jgi:hypothetical protein
MCAHFFVLQLTECSHQESSWQCTIASMSNTTTPKCARHEALLNDGRIPADGAPICLDVTGGGTAMQPEFATTHSSSVCQKVYINSGNDKTILYMLSIGLKHDNEPLFSLEQEPWSTLSKNTLLPPKNSRLVKEVLRRRATSSSMRVGPTSKELDAKSNDGVARRTSSDRFHGRSIPYVRSTEASKNKQQNAAGAVTTSCNQRKKKFQIYFTCCRGAHD